MREDFAVFILTHGRARSQITLQAILDAGYTGKWYLIVDDLDDELELYKTNYGQEHIVVFDKRQYAEKVDTMTGREELRTVLYARIAAYDIAKELGLNYFTEFDDDLSNFMVRYIDTDGKLKGKKILGKMDEALEAMVDFLERTGVYALGIDSASTMMGGKVSFGKGLHIGFYQAMVLCTDRRLEFKGILNEDDVCFLLNNKIGKITFMFTGINQQGQERASNQGGLQALYADNNEYIRALYSLISTPTIKLIMRKEKTSLKKETNHLFPKILSESWKK